MSGISLTDAENIPQLKQIFSNGLSSDAGIRINNESVFALPAMIRGVKLISGNIAKLSFNTYRKIENEGREIDVHHSAYKVLNKRANLFQNAYSFVEELISDCLWAGNGFAIIEWTQNYEIKGLHNVDPRYVMMEETWDGGILIDLQYVINGKYYQPEDVIHIKHLSRESGTNSVSVIDNLKTVLGLGLATQKFGALYFKNNTHIVKVLKIPGWLNPEQKAQIKEHWGEGCLDNAFNLKVLFGGAELESLPINASEAQWLENRKFNLIDIANALNLPGSKTNSDQNTSYGSLEQDSLSVLGDCYDLLITQLECELNCKLIFPREQVFIEVDRSELELLPAAEKQKLLVGDWHGGLRSWEETRRKMNESTVRDEKETWLVPSNLTTVEKLLEPTPEPVPMQNNPAQTQQDAVMEQEAPTDAGANQNEKEEEQKEDTVKRCLIENELERIHRRIIKNPEKRLKDWHQIIRQEMNGINTDAVIESLTFLQEEIDNNENNKEEVIEKWDKTTIVRSLMTI